MGTVLSTIYGAAQGAVRGAIEGLGGRDYVAIAGAPSILLQGSGERASNVDGRLWSRDELERTLVAIRTAGDTSARDKANSVALLWVVTAVYPSVRWFMMARTLRCSHTAVLLTSTIRSALFGKHPDVCAIVDIGTSAIKVARRPEIPGQSTPEVSIDASAFYQTIETKNFEAAWALLVSDLETTGVDPSKCLVVGTEGVRAASARSGTDGRIVVISAAEEAQLVDAVTRSTIYDLGIAIGDACVGTFAYGGGSAQGVLADGSFWHRGHAVKSAAKIIAAHGTGPEADRAFAALE